MFLEKSRTHLFGGFKSDKTAFTKWHYVHKGIFLQEADMAVASLTISYPREQDIDYTVPYLDLGMSFVMKVVHIYQVPNE